MSAEGRESSQGQVAVPANPEERVATPAVPARVRALPDPAIFGGVSWEEHRKGQPPRRPKNPDQALFNDRFTSQYMLANLPGERWKPIHPLFVPE